MLTESRELESIEYFPSRKAVNILWKDKVFRDGELLHEGDHRAALPVDDNGDLSLADEAKLGVKLRELLGDAGKDAAQKLAKFKSEKESLESEVGLLKIENARLLKKMEDHGVPIEAVKPPKAR